MSLGNIFGIQSTSLKDVLLATPYEALFNLDGFLSEEIFRKYFLVKGEAAPGFEASIQELYEAMFSSSGFDNIILLHGYKGTGKTTLLREFITRYSSEIANAYVDFHEARPDFVRENRAASLIADLLRFQFLGKEGEKHQYQALSIIKDHLRSFPISNQFAHFISSEDEVETILHKMREFPLSFSDSFILYMTLLFVKVKNTQFDGHYYVVVFDNLDAVDVEFVTPYFLDEFSRVLEATARLSQRRDIFGVNPQFTRRFRFIFAVREGNYSLLSVHFGDRLRGKIRAIDVSFYLTPKTQREIILKRLNFYQGLKEKNKNEIEKVAFIVEQWVQEPLFENILASSFNGDYRKIVEAIFELVKKLKYVDKNFWRQRGRGLRRRSYGVFGTLIRGAIDYWFPYFEPDYIDTPPNLKRDGYFHPIRMVLNLVLNLSQGGISTYRSHYEHEGYCDLYTLVKVLLKLYPCDVILRTVARLFLFHRNWVHLLSIYTDFPIEHENSLIVKLLNSCSIENNEDNNTLTECFKSCKDVEEQLRKVKIKITPAGIAYLKHLHIHFEFYSALAKEQVPLFVAGETALQGEGELSLEEVERIIEGVFKVVKNQREIMLRFYKRKFVGEMGFDVEKFLTSNYAFLFSGRRRAHQGQFHIARVITAHIDYIDNFRLFMLDGVREEKTRFLNLTPERQAMVLEINKKLLHFLKKYTYLLRRVPDPRVQQWVEILLDQIRKIESSGYTDMSTRVNLPRR